MVHVLDPAFVNVAGLVDVEDLAAKVAAGGEIGEFDEVASLNSRSASGERLSTLLRVLAEGIKLRVSPDDKRQFEEAAQTVASAFRVGFVWSHWILRAPR